MKPKNILTKRLLYEEYVVKKKTSKEIAYELGFKSDSSIRLLLKKFNISRPHLRNRFNFVTKEELYQKYIIENKSLETTANELGFKGQGIIKKLLIKFDIQPRIRTYNSQKQISNHLRKSNGYYKEIPITYIKFLKQNAQKRRLEFLIDIGYLWDLFLKQSRKCALSGIIITLHSAGSKRNQSTASLDRIDSLKGYIEGNVQWVHKDVNKMKHAFTQEYFISTCKKVASTHDSYN